MPLEREKNCGITTSEKSTPFPWPSMAQGFSNSQLRKIEGLEVITRTKLFIICFMYMDTYTQIDMEYEYEH